MQGQKVLLEKTGAQLVEQELRDFQPQAPRRDIQENSLEEPSWGGSHEQLSPHHWEKSLLQEPVLRLTETGNQSGSLALSPALFHHSLSWFCKCSCVAHTPFKIDYFVCVEGTTVHLWRSKDNFMDNIYFLLSCFGI